MLLQRQIRWYEFLSRFDFNIVYRSWKKSGKPDLLARRSDHFFNYEFNSYCRVINCLTINNDTLTNSILNALEHDEFYNSVRTSLSINNSNNHKIKNINKFVIDKERFLLFNNLIYVHKSIRTRVLKLHHDSPTAGHFGVSKTQELLSHNFWWPNFSLGVKKFTKSCEVCYKSKIPRHKPYGLLSPLSTPDRVWSDISMNFIDELPKSKDMTTIMVVIDRLTKMFILFLFVVFLLLQLLLMILFQIFLSYMVSLILLFLIENRNLHLNFGIAYVIFLILLILFLPPTIRRLMVKRRG